QSHPAFSYRPETGEERYHSFLGVPILRAGKSVGVLVVQNRTQRSYSDEEVEALQTTAMVLAELVGSGELAAGPSVDDPERDGTRHLTGLTLAEGISLGHVVLHEPRVLVTQLIAEDISHEQDRLEQAIETLRETIDDMLMRGDLAPAGEHRDVLEAYRMFAHDRGWNRRLGEAVASGLTAEAAVERVQNDTRARMVRQTDPYLREQLHDLDDLSNRLLRVLAGRTTAAEEDLPQDTILFARTMGPADLLDYDPDRLRGLVLEEGGSASHVAIVARALGLASVGQVQGAVDYADTGDEAVVDASSGDVFIRPSQNVLTAYADKVEFEARRQEQYAKLRHEPAITLDGQLIAMHVNAGLLVDLPHLEETGADGIGLFRTELQFMISATFPKSEQQREIYASVLDAAGGKPVVFRSLDIGGDKMLPYLRHAKEENPALGWRAVRMALDRPGLFRAQIRALMRATAGSELNIMLPMISEVAEFERASALVDKELAHCEKHGHPQPNMVNLGVMIEVPALLWQLEELMAAVDFVSVGSNDLLQFLFAADRSNIRVAERFDPLSPAVLRMLRDIAGAAERHRVPLTLCGEMAGRPIEAMALIALGYRSISMVPASVGPVKAMIRSLDAGAAAGKLDALLTREAVDLRQELTAFATRSGVAI
ncbi:MAG: phosphoenolpyruvate--protein phosphotransferase, partial [Hyphomicrobiales bacterium]|nr:phosphoenolpyruvate--protein phosphotransferase [Hyphomicrobiales bacterium]